MNILKINRKAQYIQKQLTPADLYPIYPVNFSAQDFDDICLAADASLADKYGITNDGMMYAVFFLSEAEQHDLKSSASQIVLLDLGQNTMVQFS